MLRSPRRASFGHERSAVCATVVVSQPNRSEGDGIVKRTVYPTNPPSVEYELTALGRSLLTPIRGFVEWAVRNQEQVALSRARFDERRAEVAVR